MAGVVLRRPPQRVTPLMVRATPSQSRSKGIPFWKQTAARTEEAEIAASDMTTDLQSRPA